MSVDPPSIEQVWKWLSETEDALEQLTGKYNAQSERVDASVKTNEKSERKELVREILIKSLRADLIKKQIVVDALLVRCDAVNALWVNEKQIANRLRARILELIDIERGLSIRVLSNGTLLSNTRSRFALLSESAKPLMKFVSKAAVQKHVPNATNATEQQKADYRNVKKQLEISMKVMGNLKVQLERATIENVELKSVKPIPAVLLPDNRIQKLETQLKIAVQESAAQKKALQDWQSAVLEWQSAYEQVEKQLNLTTLQFEALSTAAAVSSMTASTQHHRQEQQQQQLNAQNVAAESIEPSPWQRIFSKAVEIVSKL